MKTTGSSAEIGRELHNRWAVKKSVGTYGRPNCTRICSYDIVHNYKMYTVKLLLSLLLLFGERPVHTRGCSLNVMQRLLLKERITVVSLL